MKKGNVLFLDRRDLRKCSQDKPIQEICLSDFEGSKVDFSTVDVVIYNTLIHTLILKNRYGKIGDGKNDNI